MQIHCCMINYRINDNPKGIARRNRLWNRNIYPHDHGQEIENILGDMPQTQDFQTVSDIFKQLGDPKPDTDLLAFVPLRRMCDQYIGHCRHEQSGSIPSS